MLQKLRTVLLPDGSFRVKYILLSVQERFVIRLSTLAYFAIMKRGIVVYCRVMGKLYIQEVTYGEEDYKHEDTC